MYAKYTNADHTLGDFEVDGVVWTTPFPPTSGDLRERYDTFLAGGGTVEPFVSPPVNLVAYANAKQWEMAVSGVVLVEIGGQPVPFQTTEAAYSLLMGTVLDMQMEGGPTSAHWQVGPTSFLDIDKAGMIAAGRAVKAHIQATFDKLPAIFADIADGSITTPAEIDDAFNQ